MIRDLVGKELAPSTSFLLRGEVGTDESLVYVGRFETTDFLIAKIRMALANNAQAPCLQSLK